MEVEIRDVNPERPIGRKRQKRRGKAGKRKRQKIVSVGHPTLFILNLPLSVKQRQKMQ